MLPLILSERKAPMNAAITHLKRPCLLGLLMLTLLCKPVSADENDFRCLKSVGLKKPVRLQFTFQSGNDDLGYVNYQRSSGPLQVRKTKERELRQVPGGRPSEIEITWEEVTPDSSGGSYVMVVQGARVYGFSYIRKKDGKLLKFEEDLDALTEQGCDWNKR